MDTISLIRNNYFQILNGSWLKGYPLPASQSQRENTPEQEAELFYTNAFLFWNHRDIIYSDSRTFLAPVPVYNSVAYINDSVFRHPTLGIYLEWWERCRQAHVITSKGEQLLWQICGSPLSGKNTCAAVNKEGKSTTISVYPFNPMWHSLIDINSRYDSIKPIFETYSLEQVIQKLR